MTGDAAMNREDTTYMYEYSPASVRWHIHLVRAFMPEVKRHRSVLHLPVCLCNDAICFDLVYLSSTATVPDPLPESWPGTRRLASCPHGSLELEHRVLAVV